MNSRHKAWKVLLEGGSIAMVRRNVYSVRDEKVNPIRRITERTFYHVRKLCRKDKIKRVWVIDKNKVRQLHGNDWVKVYYKKLKAEEFPYPYRSIGLESGAVGTITGKP